MFWTFNDVIILRRGFPSWPFICDCYVTGHRTSIKVHVLRRRGSGGNKGQKVITGQTNVILRQPVLCQYQLVKLLAITISVHHKSSFMQCAQYEHTCIAWSSTCTVQRQSGVAPTNCMCTVYIQHQDRH